MSAAAAPVPSHAPVSLQVNGRPVSFALSPRTGLLDALRNGLGLTGTRFGCGEGQCGACAVLVDCKVEAACHLTLAAVEGRSVETVESLSLSDPPHPLVEAVVAVQAGQCGYCLSGVLVSAAALLARDPKPSRETIARALDWHLCRCGDHNRILDAVELAASRIAEARP